MPQTGGATKPMPWEPESLQDASTEQLWPHKPGLGHVLIRELPFLRTQSSAGTLSWLGSAGLLEVTAW